MGVPLEEEIEEDVVGTLLTRWDCPFCEDVNELEGDATGETVKCESCGREFKIGHC